MVFGGFSPESLRDRINDSQCKLLITADGGYRRGQIVPLKRNADRAVADKALERETGARGLRSILEEALLDVQFELPSRRDVRKCVVTRETISDGRRPTLVTEAVAGDEHEGDLEAEAG